MLKTKITLINLTALLLFIVDRLLKNYFFKNPNTIWDFLVLDCRFYINNGIAFGLPIIATIIIPLTIIIIFLLTHYLIKLYESKNISEVNERTKAIYNLLSVEAENPEFILSKFVLSPEITKIVLPEYENPGGKSLIALRAVFMKHWYAMDDFYYLKELIEVLELKAKQ